MSSAHHLTDGPLPKHLKTQAQALYHILELLAAIIGPCAIHLLAVDQSPKKPTDICRVHAASAQVVVLTVCEACDTSTRELSYTDRAYVSLTSREAYTHRANVSLPNRANSIHRADVSFSFRASFTHRVDLTLPKRSPFDHRSTAESRCVLSS